MSDYQKPAPAPRPERPSGIRFNRDQSREQPKPTPELNRRPRFIFTDFASI